MEYQLIRSRRKTIAVCIAKDGSVIVRAPLRAAQGLIERFLWEKREWIAEKSGEMAERDALRKEFRVAAGSVLPLLGQAYPVVYGTKVGFDGSRFIVPDEAYETLKPKLVQVYKSLAEQVIPPRVEAFSKQTGWVPAGVRVPGRTG